MDDDSLKTLLQAGGHVPGDDHKEIRGTMAVLLSSTIEFRDKLKAETGVILTVEDTQKTLGALETFFVTNTLPEDLTPNQCKLAQVWINRLTHE